MERDTEPGEPRESDKGKRPVSGGQCPQLSSYLLGGKTVSLKDKNSFLTPPPPCRKPHPSLGSLLNIPRDKLQKVYFDFIIFKSSIFVICVSVCACCTYA